MNSQNSIKVSKKENEIINQKSIHAWGVPWGILFLTTDYLLKKKPKIFYCL